MYGKWIFHMLLCFIILIMSFHHDGEQNLFIFAAINEDIINNNLKNNFIL